MRPINLIPPEERRGDRAPLRSGPLAYALVGALLLTFLGVYVFVSTENSISENKAQVSSLEQELASTQARAAALASFSSFASLETARTDTVSTLARSRFDWQRVMRELALVIPADVSLTALSGSVAGAGASGATSETGTDTAVDAPLLQMSGCASDHDGVARLLAALRDIDGVTRVGLSSSEKSAESAVSTAATSATPGEESGGCSAPGQTSFELTVAFDDVEVDPTTGGIVPQAPPEPQPADESGVAETEADHRGAQDEVDAADDRAQEAVDRYLPGA